MLRVSYPTEGYRELFEIRKASTIRSGVLQSLPKRQDNINKTMRSCIGMMNMANAGFVIFCPWTFTVAFDGSDWNISFPEHYNPPVTPNLMFHPKTQHGEYLKDYGVLKISLPMTLKDKSDTQYLYHAPSMHNLKLSGDAQVVSGITDFKYVEELNVFIALKEDSTKTYSFETGDVLMQLIPMSNKEPELNHVIGYPDQFWTSGFWSSVKKSSYFKARDFLKKVGT